MIVEQEANTSSFSEHRIRGYQVKARGRGEPKKNRKAYNRLDDTVEAVSETVDKDSAVPSKDLDGQELEDLGLGQLEIHTEADE